MCKFMSSCVSFLVHFIYYLQNANNRLLNYKGTATQLMGYLIIYMELKIVLCVPAKTAYILLHSGRKGR